MCVGTDTSDVYGKRLVGFIDDVLKDIDEKRHIRRSSGDVDGVGVNTGAGVKRGGGGCIFVVKLGCRRSRNDLEGHGNRFVVRCGRTAGERNLQLPVSLTDHLVAAENGHNWIATTRTELNDLDGVDEWILNAVDKVYVQRAVGDLYNVGDHGAIEVPEIARQVDIVEIGQDLAFNLDIEDALVITAGTRESVTQIEAHFVVAGDRRRKGPCHFRTAGVIPALGIEDGAWCRGRNRRARFDSWKAGRVVTAGIGKVRVWRPSCVRGPVDQAVDRGNLRAAGVHAIDHRLDRRQGDYEIVAIVLSKDVRRINIVG